GMPEERPEGAAQYFLSNDVAMISEDETTGMIAGEKGKQGCRIGPVYMHYVRSRLSNLSHHLRADGRCLKIQWRPESRDTYPVVDLLFSSLLIARDKNRNVNSMLQLLTQGLQMALHPAGVRRVILANVQNSQSVFIVEHGASTLCFRH